MKSAQTLVLSLATVALLGACQSMTEQRTIPRSSSNWNAGSIGESAAESFLGASSQSPDTIRLTSRNSAVSMTTAARRHFFNDNPDNPLQEHRYSPGDRYIPIYHMPLNAVGDLWDITRSMGTNALDGAVGAVLMPWHLFIGADQNTGVTSPVDPEDFRVEN